MKIFKKKYAKIITFFLVMVLLVIFFDKVVMYWYVGKDEVRVVNVIGLRQNDAIEILNSLNLQPVIAGYRYDDKFPKNTVLSQRPAPNSVVKEGRRVHLILSSGEEFIEMPTLINRSLRDASFIINRLGLVLGETSEDTSADIAAGLIMDQSIPAGKKITKGTRINLVISAGIIAGDIDVPNLVNKSLAETERILKNLKLKVGNINYIISLDKLPNTVIDQYPRAGEKIKEGGSIDLFIAKEKVIEEE